MSCSRDCATHIKRVAATPPLSNSKFYNFNKMQRRATRLTRQSAAAAANNTADRNSKVSVEEKENEEVVQSSRSRRTRTRKRTRTAQSQPNVQNAAESDSESYIDPDPDTDDAPVKRRKIQTRLADKNAIRELYARIFGQPAALLEDSNSTPSHIELPTRKHDVKYHHPLLLDSRQARTSLLEWFDGVSTARNMPWRKAWIDPTAGPISPGGEDLRQRLERRAYEVWISEIMLQQTRVAAVIDYWNRWMARWPTMRDLARAEPDDVLAAWRGLGYYSRATRIHKAAKAVCKDKSLNGLLPSGVEELVSKVPGVGRYTAGAIAAIVFGRAAPMVDGNVLRVLSRLMGVLGDVQKDKGVVDLLWEAADRLVKAVARDRPGGGDGDGYVKREEEGDEEEEPSDRPGRWGQALMELGSTVCTPKPNCAECPITSSCRAYGEGLQLASKKGLAPKLTAKNTMADIEDACRICKQFKDYADDDDEELDMKTEIPIRQQKSKAKTQATLQSFAFTQTTTSATATTIKTEEFSEQETTTPSPAAMEVIANHAKKFPLKKVKKAVREEETLVCAIRRNDGRYLVHRRPEKGLLAGLWELPSYVLKDPKSSTAKTRKGEAEKFVTDLVDRGRSKGVRVEHIADLGSVPWLFSHLKLTMHVHLFEVDLSEGLGEGLEFEGSGGARSRWSEAGVVDEESMGTGMRKCWALVKEASGG
ncbi:DNA glycosylase [Annulohypoxylon truncatum]|uniref:DNA glycosylase n=1 Tax=Annulohypoxylon truncatum TaxID=327061 RepID=UPI0020086FBA|nr:DNA glycosylase [Annulohypoxylon truncatum]KAI1213671.1 DNA glycosylase [Annulohypoxylon truncatum]